MKQTNFILRFLFVLLESSEYEIITGFLQGFVDNEINFNADQSCTSTCEDYKITTQFGCHNDTPCAQTVTKSKPNICKGTIRDCEFIESDLEICPSVSNN